MKKLTLTLIPVVAAVAAFAQGTVNFGNVGTGTSISNKLIGAAVPAGTFFRAALYYLPDNSTGEAGLSWDSATAPTMLAFDTSTNKATLTPNVTSFTLAGQFIGGTRTTPVKTPPLGYAWFQVRAWEAAYQTYEDARTAGGNALFGDSIPVRVKTGDGAANPPGSLVAAGFKGFYVQPVPEPSVMGLGFLGIGALLLLRRRRQ